MQYKITILLLAACMVLVIAKPVSKKRSTLSDKPAEVFESVSSAEPVQQPSGQIAEQDIETIIVETEARVNAIFNDDNYY